MHWHDARTVPFPGDLIATNYDAIGVWVSQDCATVLQNEAVLRIRIQEKMQRHHRLGLMSEHTFP